LEWCRSRPKGHDQTKTNDPIEPWPEMLAPTLETFLADHRPRIAALLLQWRVTGFSTSFDKSVSLTGGAAWARAWPLHSADVAKKIPACSII
jgi:hypothetical protein